MSNVTNLSVFHKSGHIYSNTIIYILVAKHSNITIKIPFRLLAFGVQISEDPLLYSFWLHDLIQLFPVLNGYFLYSIMIMIKVVPHNTILAHQLVTCFTIKIQFQFFVFRTQCKVRLWFDGSPSFLDRNSFSCIILWF